MSVACWQAAWKQRHENLSTAVDSATHTHAHAHAYTHLRTPTRATQTLSEITPPQRSVDPQLLRPGRHQMVQHLLISD